MRENNGENERANKRANEIVDLEMKAQQWETTMLYVSQVKKFQN